MCLFKALRMPLMEYTILNVECLSLSLPTNPLIIINSYNTFTPIVKVL